MSNIMMNECIAVYTTQYTVFSWRESWSVKLEPIFREHWTLNKSKQNVFKNEFFFSFSCLFSTHFFSVGRYSIDVLMYWCSVTRNVKNFPTKSTQYPLHALYLTNDWMNEFMLFDVRFGLIQFDFSDLFQSNRIFHLSIESNFLLEFISKPFT